MSIKLLVFTTPTCQPCKMLKPHLERYGGETGHQIEYVDATKDTRGFQFSAVPTVVVLKNGKPTNMITGMPHDSTQAMARIRTAVAA